MDESMDESNYKSFLDLNPKSDKFRIKLNYNKANMNRLLTYCHKYAK